jgi:hypothetical protein
VLTASEAIAVVDAWLHSLPDGVEKSQFESKRNLFVTGLLAGDLKIELTVTDMTATPRRD